ncbi:HAD domain-containing protein [Kitasatospora sp. NBC_01266]|uniref:HAD domain-containing protein n=1 Tax=Kitasatospora sp. NBC_01266 TaxID=2903572 RepID=UPI003FA612AB
MDGESVRCQRPLLLLDVDGPLNPFGGMPNRRPAGFETHRLMPPSWEAAELARLEAWGRPGKHPTPLPVWLNPGHGAELAALPFELVWATTWEDEANTFIAPLIGLPELPFIAGSTPRPTPGGKVFWKTPEIVSWAAGRAFAWVDDEITSADHHWVAAHHEGLALLHRVDPHIGLTSEDFRALEDWAAALCGSA